MGGGGSKSKVKSEVVNDFVSKSIAESIMNCTNQSSVSQNIALLGALGESKAEVDNYIYNGVKNEIQASTIQNIINDTNASQGIGIWGNHNIVEDITMISTNSQSAVNSTGVTNKAKTAVDQAAIAKMENPLDAITDMIWQSHGRGHGAF